MNFNKSDLLEAAQGFGKKLTDAVGTGCDLLADAASADKVKSLKAATAKTSAQKLDTALCAAKRNSKLNSATENELTELNGCVSRVSAVFQHTPKEKDRILERTSKGKRRSASSLHSVDLEMAVIEAESAGVTLSILVYRLCHEHMVDHAVEQRDFTLLRSLLSIDHNYDDSPVSLQGLVLRGLPDHEARAIQALDVEISLADPLKANDTNEVVLQFLDAMPVDEFGNELQSDVKTLRVLCDPSNHTDELNWALNQARRCI